MPCPRVRRVALLLFLASPACAPAAGAQTYKDSPGIHVVATKQLSPRLSEVKLQAPALGRSVDVRVLVPAGYADQPQTRYPVLYLFHGTSGRAADWTTTGDAAATTAGLPMIVVMPDAGFDGDGGGYFTNWFNGGKGGVPLWETFHIDQIIPWVDASLRTVAERRGRAIYGLSQGGFGTMSYATRHPDLFVAAGSYSGALDTSADPAGVVLMSGIVWATTAGLNQAPLDAIFGPRQTQEINWRGHDPAMLAGNLRGMDLRLYTGNGSRGPLDDPVPDAGAVAVEAGAHELTRLFHGHLEEHGIPSVYRDYGPGTHSWPYWVRDLRDTVRPLMEVFERPPAQPAAIDYLSAEDRFAAWGWDVTMHRPAREFAQLRGAGPAGFTLAGSGSATVLTPGVYQPGSSASVHVTAEHADETRTLTADDGGRLRIEVPLGPGNTAQQYTPVSQTRVFSATVRIAGTRRAASCSGRVLTVTLDARRGARLSHTRVSVDGAPWKRITRKGRRVRVRLTGLGAGSHALQVRARGARRVASRRVACG